MLHYPTGDDAGDGQWEGHLEADSYALQMNDDGSLFLLFTTCMSQV